MGDGQRALQAIREGEFDLVLMDVQMPNMDGFEATAAIRESERTASRRTTIVALTAHTMKGDQASGLAAGMDDYLSKPVDLASLQALLERVGRGVEVGQPV